MPDVEKQKQEFLSLCRDNIHRDGLEDLLGWLQKSDFFTAPASTRYHGAYEGGLCEHSLDVYGVRHIIIRAASFFCLNGIITECSRKTRDIVFLLRVPIKVFK